MRRVCCCLDVPHWSIQKVLGPSQVIHMHVDVTQELRDYCASGARVPVQRASPLPGEHLLPVLGEVLFCSSQTVAILQPGPRSGLLSLGILWA